MSRKTRSPELPAISKIDPASIPSDGRSAPITDAQRQFADTLRELLDSGDAVNSAPYVEREAAEKNVGFVKRLVRRALPDYPGEGKAIRWSVGSTPEGFRWFARIGEPSKAGGRRPKENGEAGE